MNRKDTGRSVKTVGTKKAASAVIPADQERAALLHLKKAHPELHAAALPYKGQVLSRLTPQRTSQALFERLASSIVSQQLSTKAAASIYARLKEKLGGKVTPAGILKASSPALRSAGLSESKVKSLKELSKAIESKKLDLLALKKVTPDEAVIQLSIIYGIGQWTAEMFLIFAVGSPDVFSPGDLILARRMQKLMNLPADISKKEMAKLAERWSPHRSYVSLLFWKLHHAEMDR